MSSAMADTLARREQLKGDKGITKEIPYLGHLDAATITTEGRDYIQVIKLSGISFLSADDVQLNSWHRSLNNTLRNIASSFPNIAFWQHIDRHEENAYPKGKSNNFFADQLNEKYAANISKVKMKVNDLYLSVVFRPQKSFFSKKIFDLLMKNDNAGLESERAENLNIINKAVDELLIALRRYDPERLTVYQESGVNYSAPLEFYSYLVNGERNKFPIGRLPAKFSMPTSRLFFGVETVEMRTPTKSVYGAMLGIKEYPADTEPGIFNALLSSDFEFVLTQSFSFISKETARRMLKLTRNRMNNADDDAKELIDDLKYALNDLSSNRFVMGQHHFSLFVKGDKHTDLLDNVSKARSVLGDLGMVTAREDLALEAAYWAQLPCNFAYRPRVAAITSRNFAGFSPFHNFLTGRKSGNHWGEALTLLTTAGGTPLYFSYHASDPTAKDNENIKKDVGHTAIYGPNGSGKTVLVGFTIAMMQKFGATTIMFTKDNDSEILIRALGGRYYSIVRGEPTGWNPFQLPNNPENLAFLQDLVLKLASQGRELSEREEKEVGYSVEKVFSMDKGLRRLGRVLDYLDNTVEGGAFSRLEKWCYASSNRPGSKTGPYAWVFDNKNDVLMENFGSVKTTGFDITNFLDDPTLRTPITMYLFHLINRLVDGRRIVIHLAEFWKLLSDEYFQDFAEDKLKTIRKKNGMVILDSQSPSDALRAKISKTLMEQTATKIVFPIPGANKIEFTSNDKGMNFSEREYNLIAEEIPEGSRMFLVKQGHSSVVAKLDLKGMDNELAVISARTNNVTIVNELIKKYGENPEAWLPEFYKLKRSE